MPESVGFSHSLTNTSNRAAILSTLAWLNATDITNITTTSTKWPDVLCLNTSAVTLPLMLKCLNATGDTSSAGDQDSIPWQTIFWAFVPLALGNMMQPVGRVLDELPQSRFWMRVSPITCLVDMVLFFTWVLVDYFDPFQPQNIIEGSRWASFCYHFRAEVAYRFRDGDKFFPSRRLLEVKRYHHP
ncbi:hypothetical protein VTJ04DRAFT_10553 [Mycothermus thermophilus]|uniref:uncharacterized protein n=1 Tax=Humicola insolens TaxID=85995 RepID=UPI003742BD33